MSYQPRPAEPRDIGELWQYLKGELSRISAALSALETAVPTYNAPPRRPSTGLLVIADGTDWNPGSGKGLYIFNGSTWTFIQAL